MQVPTDICVFVCKGLHTGWYVSARFSVASVSQSLSERREKEEKMLKARAMSPLRKNKLGWWQNSVAPRVPPEISCIQRENTWIWSNGTSRKSEAIWRCFWLCHKVHRCGLVEFFCKDFSIWQEKKTTNLDFPILKLHKRKEKALEKELKV